MLEVRASLYKKNDNSKLNGILNALIVLVICVLVAEIYFTANYAGVYVVGRSMNPTLTGAKDKSVKGGDYVYIDKRAKPTYGDIVVVFNEQLVVNGDEEEGFIIKRAIAFGGDSVKIVEGELWIKYSGETEFEPVKEDYLSSEYNSKTINFENNDVGYPVPEGNIFLLGDNRNDSYDSREFGSLPLSNVDGVVTRWSLTYKSFCTAVHNYFNFDLPSHFGLK